MRTRPRHGQPRQASGGILKNMRHCIAVLAFCWLFLQCLAAQTVRVASWELEGLEATGSDALASESEAKRPATIADTLRGLDADVIILRGIPDAPAAKRVA